MFFFLKKHYGSSKFSPLICIWGVWDKTPDLWQWSGWECNKNSLHVPPPKPTPKNWKVNVPSQQHNILNDFIPLHSLIVCEQLLAIEETESFCQNFQQFRLHDVSLLLTWYSFLIFYILFCKFTVIILK